MCDRGGLVRAHAHATMTKVFGFLGSSGCIGIAPLSGTTPCTTCEIFGDPLGELLACVGVRCEWSVPRLSFSFRSWRGHSSCSKAIRSISSIRRIRTPRRLSALPGTASIASMRDDTGLLQPETQSVARVDPRAQHALHAVHGRFARRRTHEGLAKAARAAR